MKGCAFSAIVAFLGWPALAIAISVWLTEWHGAPREETYGVAIIAGLIGWIGLALLNASRKSWQERVALVNGMDGRAPADGSQAVLVGHIEPEGGTLRAPFSGAECVAYAFEIFRMIGTGRQSRRAVYYEGLSIVPSRIITRSGSYRLLAVPEFDFGDADVPREQALARAREFVATTTFEAPRPAFGKSSLSERWSDSDGMYRREVEHAEECDLEQCQLSERRLDRGARVSVFGRYSAAQRAIVASPGDWSQITRVMLGEPDAIIRQLRSRVIFRLVLGLTGVGVAVAIVWVNVTGT